MMWLYGSLGAVLAVSIIFAVAAGPDDTSY